MLKENASALNICRSRLCPRQTGPADLRGSRGRPPDADDVWVRSRSADTCEIRFHADFLFIWSQLPV